VVDPGGDGLERVGAEVAGPVEELIEIEDDADLELLVSEVSSSLSERRRDVLALHGAGCKRSQIAERLGLPERVVKRDIEAIMDEARATLARNGTTRSAGLPTTSRPPIRRSRLSSTRT
jgi:DNA-directed RNA polymerase specialized sigma24 family protein